MITTNETTRRLSPKMKTLPHQSQQDTNLIKLRSSNENMSQIKGITKTNTKVVYTLTKDNEFLKQMTEVLIRLGLHENIPTGFPIHQEADEECIDIMRKEEFYHAVHGNNIDITIVYGTTRLFIIATGTEEHIEECNKYMSDYFSF